MGKTSGSWKPGECGNPNGRPHKDCSITETIKQMMREKPGIKEALAQVILAQAIGDAKKGIKPDLAAAKLVMQYMDGMPTQKVELDADVDATTTVSPVEKINQGIQQILAKPAASVTANVPK